MKKLIALTLSVVLGISCEIYFPDALSSNTKIKGTAKLKNVDNTLSSPIIEGKFICQNSIKICKSENYNKKLPKINFKNSNNNNVIYVDKNMEINSSDIGEIIVTKPNITITFKAPYTQNSLTNIQKIKSISDNTGSVTLVFKGGDYYIEELKINDENRKPTFRVFKNGFKIQTPNNTRLFIKNFEVKNNKPIPLNISLNENNTPNALLIYSLDTFSIETKGKLRGNFYLYGYSDVALKANPMSLIKGAIHSDGELIDYGVKVEYKKPENMYKLIVCNTLPPMPDSQKNNETLLGIDSNNNGIRDDVEIKILTYEPKICSFQPNLHMCNKQIIIALGFQYARAYQTILKEFNGTKESAYNLEKITSRALYCNEYFWNYWEHDAISIRYIEGIIFNTKERKGKYFNFNKQLSGGLFTSPKDSDENPLYCDINVSEIEGEMK